MAHARYSPSDSSRWLSCHGAIEFCESLPKPFTEAVPPENFHAAKGTEAHKVAELCLNDETKDPHTLTDDIELAGHVNNYVRFVREEAIGRTLEVEKLLDMSWVSPGMYGTSDAVLYDEANRHIVVIDLKYGQGVSVQAEDNTQLMLYALGALGDVSFIVKTVELIVYQPRARDGFPAARTHTITVEELHDFANEVKTAISKQKGGELTPGERQCRWCEGAAVCPALREFVFQTAAAEFEPFRTKTMDDYETNTEIAEALSRVNLIKQWCNSVEAKAQDLLEHGQSVPGFKLVRGRSIRKWTDESSAVQALCDYVDSDSLFTHKLISPTQFEKLVDRDKYEAIASKFIYVPEGKLTVAKQDDKRPAVNPFEAYSKEND